MAQHDYVIANGTGAAVRSDLNAGFAAIVSQNSGATAPSTTYAYQSWADTSAGVMKMRNGANNAWITLYQLDGEWSTIAFENGTAAAPSIYFKDSGTDTGIYSPGADQVGISTGGTVRLTTTTTGITSALPVDVPLGAVGTPSITFTGDLNTGIYSPGADQVAISTGGVQRINIEADGDINIDGGGVFYDATNNRVGIVTTSPSQSLEVTGNIALTHNAGSARYIFLTGNDTNTGKLVLQAGPGSSGFGGALSLYGNAHASYPGSLYLGTGTSSNGSIIFGIDNALDPSGYEKARIDFSGRLLVGTSSSVRSGLLEVAKATADTQIQITESSDSGDGPTLRITRTRGSSLSSPTPVEDGNFLGRIRFDSYDTAAYRTGAAITANADGQTWASGDCPTRLVFSTTADGAASPTEALRITNDCVLAYNQPTPATYAAAATLTVADLKTKIITYTGATATLTLPTGTLTEGGFSSIYTNMAFEWSVINTGAGICTIGAATAHTIVGSATVAIGASARFASRRTAANTFVSYRLV